MAIRNGSKTGRRARGVVLSSMASLGLLVAASAAHATSGYLSTWQSIYGASNSDARQLSVVPRDQYAEPESLRL